MNFCTGLCFPGALNALMLVDTVLGMAVEILLLKGLPERSREISFCQKIAALLRTKCKLWLKISSVAQPGRRQRPTHY